MWRRLRSLFHVLAQRHDFEEGMNQELHFHIEQYAEDLMRSGTPADEARRRARMEFGSLNNVEEDCREARGLHIFDELRRELNYAWRLLRKAPGFAITAVLTLAICIGANLTIFAAMDAILLRPLPFPDAARLVTIFNTYPKAGVERDGASLTNYYERRGHIPAFTSLSIYRNDTAIVGQPGATEREPVMRVSPEFFATLGRGPVLGRTFKEEETSFQTDNVVILTDGYWRQHFQADQHVIGRQIRVDGAPKVVVGVLPKDFRFLSSEARLFFPLASRPEDRGPSQRHSGGNVIQMIARLKPGADLAAAQSEIDAQNNQLEQDDPQAKAMADAGFRSLVVPLHADHVAAIRPMLLLMQAGALGLLLIGIVNLANLLLVRANGRVKELAVRQALGASRRHVVSEAMVETMLLTVTGGVLGLAVGFGGVQLLAALGADRLPLGAQIAFDGHMAVMAFVSAVILGIALATPIAWLHLRGNPAAGLQSETRGGTSNRAAQGLRHGFIVAQIALAVVLLTGAGMLGLSLKRALEVSPGFHADHVLTGQVSLVGNKYPSAFAGLAFTERLANQLRREPGVVAAGVATNVPFSGRNGKSAATIEGRMLRPGESPRGHYSYGVGGDYFRAMGLSLVAGRFLTDADSRREQRVCVVDEDFARYYWPQGNALGQRLFQGFPKGNDNEAFTIVGIVGSVKQAGLTDDTTQGAVYYPYIYRPDGNIFVTVRGSGSEASLKLMLQKTVRQIDPDLSVNDLRSMEERIDDSLVARRSPALLAGIFSAIALLLTALGTYGVLSYAVAQRRREIGVRMALGARPEQIRRQFLLLAARLLAIGVAMGGVGAWLTERAMQSMVFHMTELDWTVIGGAAGVMGVVAFAACLGPSHRAARVSPMEALAQE